MGLRSHKPLDVPAAAAAADIAPWNPQLVEPSGVSSLAPLSTSVALGFARDAYVDSMASGAPPFHDLCYLEDVGPRGKGLMGTPQGMLTSEGKQGDPS